MIQIEKLRCYFASKRLWLTDPVWVRAQAEDFSTVALSNPSCEIPKCGSSSDKCSIIPVLLGFLSSLPAGLSCSGFSRGWEQNHFCRENHWELKRRYGKRASDQMNTVWRLENYFVMGERKLSLASTLLVSLSSVVTFSLMQSWHRAMKQGLNTLIHFLGCAALRVPAFKPGAWHIAGW